MFRSKKTLVLLVAVCSAFSSGVRKSSDDACALMLKADINAAFAPRVFGDGEKGRGDFAGTAKLASVAGCTFTSRGASVRELMTVGLVVRRAPNDNAGVTTASAKGKRLWLIFSATGSKLAPEIALAGLTKVAKATLGRL